MKQGRFGVNGGTMMGNRTSVGVELGALRTPAAQPTGSGSDLHPLSRPPWTRRYPLLVALSDLMLASTASAVSWHIAHATGTELAHETQVLAFLLPVALLVALHWTRAYEMHFLGNGSEEYRRVWDACFSVAATVTAIGFLGQLPISRKYVAVVVILVGLLLPIGRWAARRVLYAARERERCLHRVIAVGREISVTELIHEFNDQPQAGFTVVGVCIDREGTTNVRGVPVVGTSRTVLPALLRTGADTVAVASASDLGKNELRRLCWELEGTGVDVVVAPALTDVAGPRLHVRPVANLPLVHIEEPAFRGIRRVLKEALDRALALVGLLLAAPFILLVAPFVRASSPGPTFYRQTRVGRGGQLFTIYKLRTMREAADIERASLHGRNEADGLVFKIRQDPRVTRVGAWLRRYSFDELPQLLNVLRGEMSLVGPRPPLPTEVAQYPDDVRRRLLVKPGMTGLWQISGRSDLSWDESVRIDLYYVENWSLTLDITILLRTVATVLSARGAY